MRIGCHVSIAGGLANAPKRASDLSCEVFQIFTRSPRGGAAPEISLKIIEEFISEMEKWGQIECYIHAPYYINFASSEEKTREASSRIIREELERGSLIGAKYIMTHLGSAREYSRNEALKITAAGIKKSVKSYRGSTKLLLEISAGAGNIIGDTFDELKYILDTCDKPDIGICIDSAHMFASGYDIKTKEGMKLTLEKINKTVGMNQVKLIHANDSKIDLGGRRDRHDHINSGKIGEAGFLNLIAAFPNLDFVLETEHNRVKEDILKLKQLRKIVQISK